jgi:hypothetical protein
VGTLRPPSFPEPCGVAEVKPGRDNGSLSPRSVHALTISITTTEMPTITRVDSPVFTELCRIAFPQMLRS